MSGSGPVSAASWTPRKWFIATNWNGLVHAFDQMVVAVRSARAHTSLQPICLIDDHDHLGDVTAKLAWLEAQGVRLIRHNAEPFAMVRAHFGAQADRFSGHWLRCDIPLLEYEDDIVLYTDIDVMFRQNLSFTFPPPAMLACAPEHGQADFSYFNSGVMLMNLPALRASREALMNRLQARLSRMAAHDDQGLFNEVYRDSRVWLANRYNWKPYWGVADDAAIVHFHGPKPTVVRRLMLGEHNMFPPEYGEMYDRNQAGYAHYMAEFEAVLKAG